VFVNIQSITHIEAKITKIDDILRYSKVCSTFWPIVTFVSSM